MSHINFITGNLTGRLGSIVGETREGTNYTKVFVPPTNPNAPGQVKVRNKFSHIGKIGSQIFKNVLVPYQFPAPHGGNQINALIKINKVFIGNGQPWDPLGLALAAGTAPGVTPTSAQMGGTGEGSVFIEYDKDPGLLATDIVIAAVYDDETMQTWANTQTAGTFSGITVKCAVDRPTGFTAYIWTARLPGDEYPKGQNSLSIALTVAHD